MDAAELPGAIASIGADAPVRLRKRAIELMSKSAPDKAVPILATLLDNGPLSEKQAAFRALGDIKHDASRVLLQEWMLRLEQGDVPPGAQLELLEAAAKHPDPSLRQLAGTLDAAAKASGPLGAWQVSLDGGDAQAGRKIFFDNEATRCTRCHTLNGQGGDAGPALDSVAKDKTPGYLLEALITPSSTIAEGFGSTTVELHNGNILMGFVTKDQDGALTIVDVAGEAKDVPWPQIKQRTPSAASAMPTMGGSLDRRQIRDLIAFLMEQKKKE